MRQKKKDEDNRNGREAREARVKIFKRKGKTSQN